MLPAYGNIPVVAVALTIYYGILVLQRLMPHSVFHIPIRSPEPLFVWRQWPQGVLQNVVAAGLFGLMLFLFGRCVG